MVKSTCLLLQLEVCYTGSSMSHLKLGARPAPTLATWKSVTFSSSVTMLFRKQASPSLGCIKWFSLLWQNCHSQTMRVCSSEAPSRYFYLHLSFYISIRAMVYVILVGTVPESKKQPPHLSVLYCCKSDTSGSQDCSGGRYHVGIRRPGTRTGSPQSCNFHDSHNLIWTHWQGILELLNNSNFPQLGNKSCHFRAQYVSFYRNQNNYMILARPLLWQYIHPLFLHFLATPTPSSPPPPIFEKTAVGKAAFVSFTISSLFL